MKNNEYKSHVPWNMTDEECDDCTDENERKVAFFVLLRYSLPSSALHLLC